MEEIGTRPRKYNRTSLDTWTKIANCLSSGVLGRAEVENVQFATYKAAFNPTHAPQQKKWKSAT